MRTTLLLFILMVTAAVRGAVTPAIQNDATTKHVAQPPHFWTFQFTDQEWLDAVRKAQTNQVIIGGGITGAVASVNGLVGIVVLTTSEIAEGTNRYWTTALSNNLWSAARTSATNNNGAIVNLKAQTSVSSDVAATLSNASGMTNGTIPFARYAGTGANSVNLGDAHASGANSVAIGNAANASATAGSVAVGHSADAENGQATALGDSAVANWGNDTAIGYSAATTKAHQIMLGTSAEEVKIPGNLQFASGNLANGTNIPAAQLTGSGTLPTAVLSGNVALLNGVSNTWTGQQNFQSNVLVSSAGITTVNATNFFPLGVGATKVPVTDSSGKLVAATLSGLSLSGTTLTATGGGGSGNGFPLTNAADAATFPITNLAYVSFSQSWPPVIPMLAGNSVIANSNGVLFAICKDLGNNVTTNKLAP